MEAAVRCGESGTCVFDRGADEGETMESRSFVAINENGDIFVGETFCSGSSSTTRLGPVGYVNGLRISCFSSADCPMELDDEKSSRESSCPS